jgi:GH18 family chitinase
MIAFTSTTVPMIAESVDFLNIMTYDLINRRDNMTKHHAGITASIDSIEAYLENGLPQHKANLGFAFYVKCFNTAKDGNCENEPIGCKTTVMEDPVTGADLGQTGQFSWHDEVPEELSASFDRALLQGRYDENGGGHYYWDAAEDRFWSWETTQAIRKKYEGIMEKFNLGGVFAWGLGEDAPNWEHLNGLTDAVRSNHQRYVFTQRP